MGLTKTITGLAAPLPKLEAFERYLFIGPHPDDIEIGAGATAAKLAALGKKITYMICMDGRYGDGNIPGVTADQLAVIRKKESIRSAAYLGVKDVCFLDLSDGGFYDYDVLVKKMAKVIGEVKPEVIFAPDPCVTTECHVDHLNTGNAARRLACYAPYAGIMKQYGASAASVSALAYYMTSKVNQCVGTTGYLKKQIRSVKGIHLSQYPKGSGAFDAIELYLKIRALEFGIRSGHCSAEGFRVLGVTQMHCLPEAED